MNEKFVKNIVMNEEYRDNGEYVKNSLMNANVDPKVAMNLSTFKIWWMEHSAGQQRKKKLKNLLMRMARGS